MGKKLLVVVDMQNDFVTGVLGTAEARAIVSKVVEKVKNFDGEIIFTRDTHSKDYLKTLEGKNLPVEHCIRNTEGWNIIPELKDYADMHPGMIYDKGSFGSVDMCEKVCRMVYYENEIESIEIIGVCTDICVISNALMLKAFVSNIPIAVDASCCAGVTPEAHLNALKAMKSCQIEILNGDEEG